MKNYKMDFETKTLIVTREFAKGLEKMASKECKIYMHFKGLVPDLKIAYRTHITNKPNHNKGLTYKKMERFIKTYSNSDELLDEFNKVVEYAGFMNNSYAIVNKWFIADFQAGLISKEERDDKIGESSYSGYVAAQREFCNRYGYFPLKIPVYSLFATDTMMFEDQVA